MPWLMCEQGGLDAVRVQADTLEAIQQQMLALQAEGRIAPESVWLLTWLAPEPDAIAVVDSQHGDLIDP